MELKELQRGTAQVESGETKHPRGNQLLLLLSASSHRHNPLGQSWAMHQSSPQTCAGGPELKLQQQCLQPELGQGRIKQGYGHSVVASG